MSMMLASVFITAESMAGKGGEPGYKLETGFTGEVKEGMDSVFVVYAVFDKKELKDKEALQVKTGSKGSGPVEKSIDLQTGTEVKEKNRKVYIEIGTAGEETTLIEIYAKDKAGKTSKLNREKK